MAIHPLIRCFSMKYQGSLAPLLSGVTLLKHSSSHLRSANQLKTYKLHTHVSDNYQTDSGTLKDKSAGYSNLGNLSPWKGLLDRIIIFIDWPPLDWTCQFPIAFPIAFERM